MLSRRKRLRNYTIKGINYLAHDENEAFDRYKKGRIVQTGDMIRIGKKFFRVIGELLNEINPKK